MYSYLTKISGYGLGIVPLLVILGVSILGGLFMVSVANYTYSERTMWTYKFQPATWVFTPIIFTLMNTLLLIPPAQPYGHWAAAAIYAIIVLRNLRNNVFHREASELNDNPFRVGFTYLIGFLPIAIPMVYLCSSITTKKLVDWQFWVSIGACAAVALVILFRMLYTNSQLKRIERG